MNKDDWLLLPCEWRLKRLGQEGEHICDLLEHFGGRLARAVAALGVDVGKQGLFLASMLPQMMLNCGDELERVKWRHAVVVVSRQQQQRRIGAAIRRHLHVVYRRIVDDRGESAWVIAAAVVALPRSPDAELVVPQHVHDAHLGNAGPKEVWPLVGAGSHQQPTIRPALGRQPAWCGVSALDQIVCCGLEIVKAVLFLVEAAVVVPRKAILCPAPDVGHGVHTTELLHPDEVLWRE
mmetsp:Transcript_18642/g.44888  ORF Transcript_18642/g.44888 Transcript_18642/m.44888 type:complete len:236 (-) Transcript_18642:1777-2484(-)